LIFLPKVEVKFATILLKAKVHTFSNSFILLYVSKKQPILVAPSNFYTAVSACL